MRLLKVYLLLSFVSMFITAYSSTFTLEDAESFYLKGQYKSASRIIQIVDSADKASVKAHILLLSMSQFECVTTATQNQDVLYQQVQSLINARQSQGLIIKALWHINKSIDNQRAVFPECYQDILTGVRLAKTGMDILKNLSAYDKHAAYLFGKFLLQSNEVNKKYKGNTSLKDAAKLGHLDCQDELDRIGVSWKDQDQFGDHCEVWCCAPPCADTNTCHEKCSACIGCQSNHERAGWVDSNCCCCGWTTELNSASIAKYFSSGFLSCLQSIYMPMKFCSTLTAAAATATHASGLTLPGIVLDSATTCLNALVLFAGSAEKELTKSHNPSEEGEELVENQPLIGSYQ